METALTVTASLGGVVVLGLVLQAQLVDDHGSEGDVEQLPHDCNGLPGLNEFSERGRPTTVAPYITVFGAWLSVLRGTGNGLHLGWHVVDSLTRRVNFGIMATCRGPIRQEALAMSIARFLRFRNVYDVSDHTFPRNVLRFRNVSDVSDGIIVGSIFVILKLLMFIHSLII